MINTELNSQLNEIAVVELAFTAMTTGPRLVRRDADIKHQYAVNLLPTLHQEWVNDGAEEYLFAEQNCTNLLKLVTPNNNQINPQTDLQPIFIHLIEILVRRGLSLFEVATIVSSFSQLYKEPSLSSEITLEDLIRLLPTEGRGAPVLANELQNCLEYGVTTVLAGSKNYVDVVSGIENQTSISFQISGSSRRLDDLLSVQLLEQLWWYLAQTYKANHCYELTTYNLFTNISQYSKHYAYDYAELWLKRLVKLPNLVLLIQEQDFPARNSDLGQLWQSSPLVRRKFLQKV